MREHRIPQDFGKQCYRYGLKIPSSYFLLASNLYFSHPQILLVGEQIDYSTSIYLPASLLILVYFRVPSHSITLYHSSDLEDDAPVSSRTSQCVSDGNKTFSSITV
jgi:hypothetical protein